MNRKPRRLVVCFDGTGEIFGVEAKKTNVIKLRSILIDDDEQICHYEPGVGACFRNTKGPVTTAFLQAGQILNQADAGDLDDHVKNGYRFLVDYYDCDDKIYLFGFSRGAFIARVLAGMLHKVGLLRPRHKPLVDNAYDLYLSTNNEDTVLDFKNINSCKSVNIHFMGIWDTVASVGFFRSPLFPLVNINPSISMFRHAVSLDEHRVRFRPQLYKYGVLDGSPILLVPDQPGANAPPNAVEVWFPGCHADIGGGNDTPGCPRGLSNIPLQWMVQEVRTLDQLGDPESRLKFDIAALRRYNLRVDLGQSGIPPDATAVWDGEDAVQPIFDELSRNLYWWILEMLPTSLTNWWPNLGRRRQLPGGFNTVRRHSSVNTRMQNMNYKPRPSVPNSQNTAWPLKILWIVLERCNQG